MLEERSINVWAYNLETVLAEKLETVISRGITNTRMRDYYDIHILIKLYGNTLNGKKVIVNDTGIGIPKEHQDRIFERFYRVDKARSRASGGSGLGLAIVRAIVQRNKGQIRVDSTLGKGSCFTVTFPVFDTEVDKE